MFWASFTVSARVRHLILAVGAPGSSLVAACVLASFVAAARSALFLLWDQTTFDADQAVVGLMAKHLAEGRAFQLFYPGQHYLLAVEAWLAAPLFWLFGPSLAMLKVPLLAFNVAIAALLVRVLTRDAGLSPWVALMVSSFFVAAVPVASSRLLLPMGGSVEPLLYVLAMWVWRRQPLTVGLVLGFGFLHREFTAYGAGALFALDVWERRSTWRDVVTRWSLTGCAMAAVMTAVQSLRAWADVTGPGTSPEGFGTSVTNVHFAALGFCLQPRSLVSNVHWTLTENLPTLLGARSHTASVFIAGEGTLGHDGWWPILVLAAVAIAARLLWLRWTAVPPFKGEPVPRGAGGFAAYLIGVGGLTLAAYAARCEIQGFVLIRYTLMALLLPVGLLAAYLRREPRRRLRSAALLLVACWTLASGIEHVRLLHQYVRRPPPDALRELSDYLVARGVRYGYATYWLAYPVAFHSNERVRMASQEPVRVLQYESLVARHRAEAVYVGPDPCPGGVQVAGVYVCPP